MIVEDDVVSQQLLQQLLVDFGSTDLVSNGHEALEVVKEAIQNELPYDLICMDIMTPEMDGMEALHQIRRLEINHFQPGLKIAKIIMITAKGQACDVMGAFRAGCEAYLIKPICKNKLVEQLSELGFSRQRT